MSDLGLINPNLFQPEDTFSPAQNTHQSITINCPHCRQLGVFETFQNNNGLVYAKRTPNNYPSFIASIRGCPNTDCKAIVLVISRTETKNGRVIGNIVTDVLPPQLIDFNLDNLPSACGETLKEAIACHAAGAHRAAAMMVRRLLEEICEHNSAVGKNLHERLESLKKKVILPQELFDAMGELKALGNDAAHIEAKDYDSIGPDEASDSIELVKEILKALYQLKGLIARLQARKKAP